MKEPLGKGGMATVYLAWDLELERKVAVKVLHPFVGDRPEALSRFHREARAAARLRHANIIEIFDFSPGVDDEPPYLVYEYVDGPDLAEFMRMHSPPFPETAALVGRCLARALAAAHERGIVHRDIKPENVLVDRSGRLVITDFGIARLTGDETVTSTGAVLGSPAYMAPEQARGEKTDQRSDVFSLGVLLYRLVTGKAAFPGETAMAVLSAVIQGDYAPAVQARPDVGPDMARVLDRAMALSPEDRYQSAREMAADLEQVAAVGGLEDFDGHLTEYLVHPSRHEARVESLVIDAALDRARKNLGVRPALALALLDRVLAFDPNHAGAGELVRRFKGAKLRRTLLVVAAGVLVGFFAVIATTWLLGRHSGGSTRTGSATAFALPDSGTSPGGRDAARSRRDGSADAARLASISSSGAGLDAGVSRKVAARTRNFRSRERGRHRVHRRTPETNEVRSVDGGLGRLPVPYRDAGPRTVAIRAPVRSGRPATGKLRIFVKPWCTIYVDGHKFGRSPSKKALVVSAGRHRVVCRQRPGQAGFVRNVFVGPGEKLDIHGSLLQPCRVLVPSGQGTWIIDGTPHKAGTYRLSAGRHRVQVFSAARGRRTRWVLFAPGGSCRLSPDPEPHCAR